MATRQAWQRIAWAWLPSFAYMGAIWWVSSMPLDLPMPELPFRDKGAHALQYGILGFLNARAVARTFCRLRLRTALLAAALLTASFGYTDEVHQAFVPGRNSSALDLLADVIGAVGGAALYGALGWLRRPGPRAADAAD